MVKVDQEALANSPLFSDINLSAEHSSRLARVSPPGVALFEEHREMLEHGLKTQQAQHAIGIILQLIDGSCDTRVRDQSPARSIDRFCSTLVKSMDMGNSAIDPSKIFSIMDLREHRVSVREMRLRVLEEAAYIALRDIFSPQLEVPDLFSKREQERHVATAEKLLALIGNRVGDSYRFAFSTALYSAFSRLAGELHFQPANPLTEAQGKFLSGIFSVFEKARSKFDPQGIAYFIDKMLFVSQSITICCRRASDEFDHTPLADSQPLSESEKYALSAIKSLERLHDIMVLGPFSDTFRLRDLNSARWSEAFISSALSEEMDLLYTSEYPVRVVYRNYRGSTPEPGSQFWPAPAADRGTPSRRR